MTTPQSTTEPAADVVAPQRRSRRRARLLVAGLLVGLTAADGWLWWGTSDARAEARAEQEALAFAERQAVAMLSYDHTTIDRDLATLGEHLAEPFRDEFLTVAEGIVAPAVRSQRATTTAEVVAASVVSADTESATILLFVDETLRSDLRTDPLQGASRVRMTLEREDGRWLVSDLTTL